MDISVVIPTLNEEKTIGSSIESLIDQDFDGKYEVIISDGKSTDKTTKIAETYGVKTVIAPKRSAAHQRNYGAKFARGKIVAFLDSDTVASRSWLSGINESFLSKNVVAATGPLFPLEKAANKNLYKIVNFMQTNLIRLNIPLFWGASCAFKKNHFDKVKGFNEKLQTSEDHDLSLRLAKRGKVVMNKKIVAFTSHRRFKTNADYMSYIANGVYYLVFKKSKQYVPIR